MTRARAAGLLALAALSTACSRGPSTIDSDRVIDDPARGVRYTCPAGWQSYEGEIRSAAGSLLTLRVFDLVDAERTFVAGLPDTILPQLLGWAKHYYIVEGEPVRAEVSVAGLPATQWTYPVRVRLKDRPSKVTYWVVRRESRLFVLRAAYPPAGLAVDEPAVLRVIDGWSFLDPPATPASGS